MGAEAQARGPSFHAFPGTSPGSQIRNGAAGTLDPNGDNMRCWLALQVET